jgi:hypothetical protein
MPVGMAGVADVTSTAGGGTAAMPIGASTFFIPIGTIGISTILHAGAYEKPIVFQNCQAWKHCASLVAKDVETWLEANAAALAHDKKPATPPATPGFNEPTIDRLSGFGNSARRQTFLALAVADGSGILAISAFRVGRSVASRPEPKRRSHALPSAHPRRLLRHRHSCRGVRWRPSGINGTIEQTGFIRSAGTAI